MVLNDFQRGKLPYYVLPPGCDKTKLELKQNEEFIEKMLAEQNEIAGKEPSEPAGNLEATEEKEEGESKEEVVEPGSETILAKTKRESMEMLKIAQKLAEKKKKIKTTEKKKVVELKGLKKKLKDWHKK